MSDIVDCECEVRVKYADYEVEDCRGKKKLGGRISRYGQRVEDCRGKTISDGHLTIYTKKQKLVVEPVVDEWYGCQGAMC